MSADVVLKKIQKLFALAAEGSGGTEAERNAALEKAQALMLKHGLEMSQVAEQGDASRNIVEELWDEVSYKSGDLRELLLNAVARGCHCRTYYHNRPNYSDLGKQKTRRYTIVGRPENVAYVRAVYAFVLPQVEAQIAKEFKARDKRAQYARAFGINSSLRVFLAQGMSHSEAVAAATDMSDLTIAQYGMERAEFHPDRESLCQEIHESLGVSWTYATDISPFVKRGEVAPEWVEDMAIWKRSFTQSCCSTIHLKLRDSRRTFVEEHGDSAHALVIQEDAAVDAFMDDLDLKKVSSEAQVDPRGWQAGAKAGSSVTIGGGTSLSSQRRQIGA